MVWGTGVLHNYRHSIFSHTWWNIVLFHTFFALTIVTIFAATVYHIKTSIFQAMSDILAGIVAGTPVDPTLLTETSVEINQLTTAVLVGVVVVAICASIALAHITLKPTRRSVSMQKQFIGSIAHELRTPLAIMRTQNEVALYEVEKDSPMHEVINENLIQINLLVNILNNLLVFSRIDTSESIRFSSVELQPLVESIIKRLEKLADKRRVIVELEAGSIPNIYGNETAVEQAIYNTVRNAILYAKPTGGNVAVTISHEHGDKGVVVVKDNGVGIPHDQLKHVFEPFYRVDDQQSEQVGSGLGLALVFEIMKLHRGAIGIESREGRGTTLTLKFPLWNKAETTEPTATDDEAVVFEFSNGSYPSI